MRRVYDIRTQQADTNWIIRPAGRGGVTEVRLSTTSGPICLQASCLCHFRTRPRKSRSECRNAPAHRIFPPGMLARKRYEIEVDRRYERNNTLTQLLLHSPRETRALESGLAVLTICASKNWSSPMGPRAIEKVAGARRMRKRLRVIKFERNETPIGRPDALAEVLRRVGGR